MPAPPQDDPDDPVHSTRMSLGEHLDELRRRLVRGLLAIGVAFFVGWFFYEDMTEVVLRPMHQSLAWRDRDQVEKYERELAQDPGLARSTYFTSDDPENRELKPELTVARRPQALGYSEPFWFAMKVTLVFAFTLGAPVLLWQMWQFVAAGLYSHERRIVLAYFPASLVLFAAGVLFGYFLLLPYGFYYLSATFPAEKVEFVPRLDDYFSLLGVMTLALGLIFQLPLLMHVLVRLDLVRRETFARYRAHFIVGAFVIGGVLTPPDPFTQSMLAVPMVLLFEVGLLSTRLLGKKP